MKSMFVSYPRSRRFGSLFETLVLAGLGLFLSVQGSIPVFAESSDNNLPTGGVTISGSVVAGGILTASNDLEDADGLGSVWNSSSDQDAMTMPLTMPLNTCTTHALGTTLTIGRATTRIKAPTSATSNTYVYFHDEENQTQGTVAYHVHNYSTVERTVDFDPPITVSAVRVCSWWNWAQLVHLELQSPLVSYGWNRDGVAIDGATDAAYTLTGADVGAHITVTASYIDAQGTPESVTSAPTEAVGNLNNLPAVASALPDITPAEDDPDLEIDLAPVFHDEDPVDDAGMSYAVSENSNAALVTTSIAGDTLTLGFQDDAYGEATITVTATSGADAAPGASFNVGGMNGLALWLDATNIDGLNNSTLSPGDAVNAWKDLSGNNHHAVSGGSSDEQGILSINDEGKQAITFDHQPGYVIDAPVVDTINQTVFIVEEQQLSDDEQGGMLISFDPNHSYLNWYEASVMHLHVSYRADDVLYYRRQNTSTELYKYATNSYILEEDEHPRLIAFTTYDDLKSKIIVNGSLVNDYDWPYEVKPLAENHQLLVADYFRGDMAEIIVLNRALSSVEIAAVQAYLSKKWGLTGTVDSDGDGVVDANDPDADGDGVADALPVVPGLKLHLDAANIDGAGNSTLSDGDVIGEWKDLSGNGNDASQSSPGYSPSYDAGGVNPAVRFGFNNFLATTLPGGMTDLNGDETTVIALLKQEVVAANPYGGSVFFSTRPFGNELRGFTVAINDKQEFIAFSREPGGGYLTSLDTVDLNNYHILTFRTRENSHEIFKGGSVVASDTNPSSWGLSNNGNIVLGKERHAALVDGYNFVGEIAEVLVFDQFIGNGDLFKINSYLAEKWGLAATIDSDGDGTLDSNDSDADGDGVADAGETSGTDTVSDTFVVTITNINDVPIVAGALPGITAAEDDPDLDIDLAPVFHDADPDDDAAMSYAVTENTDPSLVATSITGDTLTLDFQDGAYGAATISVTATSGADTVSDTFEITVAGGPAAITGDNFSAALDVWFSDEGAAISAYGHITNWDVSAVTDMSGAFESRASFNEDISSWDVGSVTAMDSMFPDATSLSDANKCAIHASFSSNANWPYDWGTFCPDTDGDGVKDFDDAFPSDPAETEDSDSDGVGDNGDAFPLDATESVDTDSDGTGNNADTDDDNDGVADGLDAFPLDATESVDTDGDGYGDNSDKLPGHFSRDLVFEFTGEPQYWVIPESSMFLHIDIRGAAGGDAIHHRAALSHLNTPGGRGGTAVGLLEVDSLPSRILQVNVGGRGTNGGPSPGWNGQYSYYNSKLNSAGGWNGGGAGYGFSGINAPGESNSAGGGASDIRIGENGLQDRIIVAGGGGGSQFAGGWSSSRPMYSNRGGAGGGETGQGGQGPANEAGRPNSDWYRGGAGGSQTAGGIAGLYSSGTYTPEAGSLGHGGNAFITGVYNLRGAGGGGGYYGGGAGFTGGGGSSFADSSYFTDVEHVQGNRAGNGIVYLTYSAPENLLNADTDGDGVNDFVDVFPSDPTETVDTDFDGVGDNADAFPEDRTETADSDSDGTGDNGDAFPMDPGETRDSDADGVGDNGDAFPNDPNETADSDSDGVGDNGDAFPEDPGESVDSDSDGVGDNGDAFPQDANETTDSDSDGVGDNGDAFPNDGNETVDSDSDGVGDNGDAFPQDATETADSDSDGVGDNADVFPNEPNDVAIIQLYADFLALQNQVAELEGTVSSNATEIAELSQRPTQVAHDAAVATARTGGRSDVTGDPASYNLVTQASYDAVVVERDTRPTAEQLAAVEAERDALPTQAAYNAVVVERDTLEATAVSNATEIASLEGTVSSNATEIASLESTVSSNATEIAELSQRPTQASYDAVVAERNARPTLEQVRDGRPGSVLLSVDSEAGSVVLNFTVEESEDLTTWTPVEGAGVSQTLTLPEGKRFYRFAH